MASRARATEKVLARYRDKPFTWQGANCIRLARAQAVAFGYKVPPVPLFRSALGARKALAKMGAAGVAELLDQYFARHIAPAFMLMGDLCALRGEVDGEGLEAICIADGYGNLFGWHDDRPEGLATIKHAQADIITAWSL